MKEYTIFFTANNLCDSLTLEAYDDADACRQARKIIDTFGDDDAYISEVVTYD